MAKHPAPMPTLLNPAPNWEPERSDFIILWHGCTAVDKASIEKGIDLAFSEPNTDFGRGFYTTTLEQQARHFAWERFYAWRMKNPNGPINAPVVLRFRVPRHASAAHDAVGLTYGLDELSSLQFVRAAYDSEDYWSFVQHCRKSTDTDPRDHERPPTGWYELVSGPVAAFWRQRVAMHDAEQFSFHKGGGITLLNALVKKNAPHYRSIPVQ